MVAERYERPAKIAAAYAALPDEDDPEYLAQLSKASLELEVVIIARRATEDAALRRQIGRIAADRALPIIEAIAIALSRGKVPRWERDDVKGLANLLFWEEIQAESYFEVHFRNAAITIVKRARARVLGGKQRQRDREATDREPDDFPESRTDDPSEAIVDDILIRSALGTLSEDQQRAITIHHLMGRPIFSENPAISTVASALKCAERKARQVIADAQAKLERWGEREKRND